MCRVCSRAAGADRSGEELPPEHGVQTRRARIQSTRLEFSKRLGLVLKAQRPMYHSTLGWRVINRKKDSNAYRSREGLPSEDGVVRGDSKACFGRDPFHHDVAGVVGIELILLSGGEFVDTISANIHGSFGHLAYESTSGAI